MSAPQEQRSGSAFVNNSDMMRKAMQGRTLSNVAHLTPVLDALSSSSVICEVGCGPGGITLDIARRYPQFTILGIDIDDKSIDMANTAATEAGVKNLRYIIGDVTFLTDLKTKQGFEALDGGCDIVYTNAVIAHCPDAAKVVKEMRAAAKVGALVSMAEGDAGLFFAYPPIPGMMKMLEAFPAWAAGKGGDPKVGRKLLSHALAAGFSRDDITSITVTGDTTSKPQERQGFAAGFENMFRLADPEVLQRANLQPADLDFIAQGLKEWANCEDGLVSFPTIVVDCIKRS